MRVANDMTITVDKKELLERLHENMEKHKKTYEMALVKFRQEVIQLMADKLHELQEPTWRNMRPQSFQEFGLPVPTCYAAAYQEVIEMLEMAKDEELTITAVQFRCWCKDEWDWSHSFHMNSGAYLR